MTGVVALHGFSGAGSVWYPLFAPFAVKLCAPNIVGHADANSAHAPQSFEQELERLAGAIEREMRESFPIHLVGYSLGGRLALGLALRHPDWFASLVLIGADAGLSTTEARKQRLDADRIWAELLQRQGISAFVQAWEALPLWASQTGLAPPVLAAQRALRLSHDASALARGFLATSLGNMPDYWPQLGHLKMPVKIVVGALDQKFSQIAERMQQQIPQARLLSVPGAGHNVLLECPLALQQLLESELGLRRASAAPAALP